MVADKPKRCWWPRLSDLELLLEMQMQHPHIDPRLWWAVREREMEARAMAVLEAEQP